jgi:ABC-type multidrug transport system permease subunit
MKDIIIDAITITIVAIVMYLICSFISNDINIFRWETGIMIFYSCTTASISLMILGAKEIRNSNKNNYSNFD